VLVAHSSISVGNSQFVSVISDLRESCNSHFVIHSRLREALQAPASEQWPVAEPSNCSDDGEGTSTSKDWGHLLTSGVRKGLVLH